MIKSIVIATVLLATIGSAHAAGTGRGQPSENANALGVERATRNSDGGDREHGGFGPAQSSFVHEINNGTEWDNYGEFLQDWKADAND